MIKLFTVLLTAVLVMPFFAKPVQAQDEIAWLLEQINALRASKGLPPYELDATLSIAAQSHSQWMADTGIISHDETSGSTPKSRAASLGYPGSLISENIYGGGIAQATDAWNFWISSPAHYNGLTHELFNEVGIGIGSGEYGRFYTLVFGNGGSVSVLPQPTSPPEETPVTQNHVPEQQSVQAAAAIAAPAQIEPSPVMITWTPSPTFPTDTPTVTWTPTFTWTPSPTGTSAPPTSTTVPLSVIVANLPVTPTPTEFVIALAPMYTPTPGLLIKKVAHPENSRAANWRIVLPVLIILQVVMIGIALKFMFKQGAA